MKIFKTIKENKLEFFTLFTITFLIFILPVPHTIAIRNILQIILLLNVLALAFKKGTDFSLINKMKFPIIILLIFLIWGYFQAIFISDTTKYSLKELSGQLLQATIYFFISIFIIAIKNKKFLTIKNIFNAIFISLLLHIIILDLSSLILFYQDNKLYMRYGGPLILKCNEMNYLTNLFSVIVIGEIFFRITYNKRFLPYSNKILFIVLLLILYSLYVETIRFGILTFAILLFTFIILYILHAKKNIKEKIIVLFSIIIIIFSIGYLDYRYDKRWKTLIQTIPIALDLNSSKHWIDSTKYPLPKLNGKPVNQSNYLRPAQFKAALCLILENPLGTGFGRRAYKHALIKKYGEGYGHPHSGILNLGIGVGLIGLFLWFLFIGFIVYDSLIYFKKHRSYFSLILLLFVIGFTARSFVDMTYQNHFLQFFMFFTGFLYASLKKEFKNEKA